MIAVTANVRLMSHTDMSIYFTNGLNIDAAIETEFAQSRNAVDACVKAGVKHIVFSALDEFEGDKAVPYFVSKARGECDEHIRTLGNSRVDWDLGTGYSTFQSQSRSPELCRGVSREFSAFTIGVQSNPG
jgi:hypothetical protein